MPWMPHAHRSDQGGLSKNVVNPISGSSVLNHSIMARHARVTAFLNRHSIALLRIALGVVFFWFGALKLTGATPVAQLVRDSVPFISPPSWLVPALGVFEVGIGLCLLAGAALPVVLPLFVGHMIATFSVLVMQPDVAFMRGDPLLLSVTGEFVVKNLVLLAAGIAVCTWRPAATLALDPVGPAPAAEQDGDRDHRDQPGGAGHDQHQRAARRIERF